jgi:hypothetical protein
VPSDVGLEVFKLFYLRFRFLDSALSEVTETRFISNLYGLNAHGFAHSYQRDIIWRTSGTLAGFNNPVFYFLNVPLNI